MNDKQMLFGAKPHVIKKKDIIAGLRLAQDEDISSTGMKDKKYYYEFIELLGEGAFCKVFKALYKPNQEVLAVKVILLIALRLFRL